MILRLSVIALVVSAACVAAEPRVTERISYYSVSGSTFSELRDEMAVRGPNGFWGFTFSDINWTRRCLVRVDILIVLPRLSRPEMLRDQDQRRWQAMVSALERHERQHAALGVAAGREVMNSRCQNPERTIRKWAERERLFDQRTDRGRLEGVWLPD